MRNVKRSVVFVGCIMDDASRFVRLSLAVTVVIAVLLLLSVTL
jgi:hypothetical protein